MTLTLSQEELGRRSELVLGAVKCLEGIEEEQQKLRPGFVRPADARRRLSYANWINRQCQLLRAELADSRVLDQIKPVGALAESVLRENPVIQASWPLYAVRVEDMPERHVLGASWTWELRRGFGLHRETKNDAGASVVIAYTQPEHRQGWHSHTVNEDTLAVDDSITAEFMDNEVRILKSYKEAMFHFEVDTYHTLINQSRRQSRTLTVKSPLGMSAWLPVSRPTPGQRGVGRVYGPAEKQQTDWGGLSVFGVSDTQHQYTVEILHLAACTSMYLAAPEESIIYVLDGSIMASLGQRSVTAARDGLIISARTRRLKLSTGATGARLYRVIYSPGSLV